MLIQTRPLRLRDFDVCWNVFYRDPFAGIQTGTIRAIWAKLLGERRMFGSVVEDVSNPAQPCVLYAGATVFLSDPGIERLARTHVPYALPRLLLTAGSSQCPILDEPAIARANAGGGLNLAIVHHGWQRGLSNDDFFRMQSGAVAAYQQLHQGYHLKGMWHENYGLFELEFCVSSGCWVVQDDYPAHHASVGATPSDELRPFLLRATKHEVYPATPTAAMFVFSPPLFGLTRLEKIVLEEACNGLGNKQIAEVLKTPEDNIRRTFRRIYARLQAKPALAATILGNGDGKSRITHSARREALLDYIRSHKEEIRPWPRHTARVASAAVAASGFPLIPNPLDRSKTRKKSMGDWLAGYAPAK